MNILIADDESLSRLTLEETLKRAGHRVLSTQDGQHALEAWSKEFFPVVISDWFMPKVDGLALCREIRKASMDRYTYFVLLTAHGGKANYLEAMKAGVDDFLTKPHDEEQLVARLHVAERIIGLRQHVRRLEGLLPICSSCKKIRDEQDQWSEFESYIGNHAEVTFSHSFCPDCAKTFLMEAGLAPVTTNPPIAG